MSKTWNWVGWGIGAIFFATSLVREFNILAKIAGLAGAIKAIGAVLGGGGDDSGAGGDVKGQTVTAISSI